MLSGDGLKDWLEACGMAMPRDGIRAKRIAKLLIHARRTLGSDAEARDFLTASHPRLDGLSPLAATRSAEVTRRVDRLLTELEYGLAS